ncbi:hypothetical protein ABID53_000250 [Bacillus oleivorans]
MEFGARLTHYGAKTAKIGTVLYGNGAKHTHYGAIYTILERKN